MVLPLESESVCPTLNGIIFKHFQVCKVLSKCSMKKEQILEVKGGRIIGQVAFLFSTTTQINIF